MLDAQVRMALTIDNAQYTNLSDAADEHEPIVNAIESGDAQTAADLIQTHILSSLNASAPESAAKKSRSRR